MSATTVPNRNIGALILAGGVNRISLYDGYIPGYKGFVTFCGKPSIQYVLDAVAAVPQIGRVCVAGPEKDIRERLTDQERYEYIPSGDTPGESIARGLGYLHGSPTVLIIPADLPLVTAQAIDDFIKTCALAKKSRPVHLFWAMVREDSFIGPYRDVKKGFNHFRDVSICHGNLFLADPNVLKAKRFPSLIDRIYSARKSSAKSAFAADPLTGIYYFLGVRLFRLFTLGRMAEFVSKSTGIEIVPVVFSRPEIAVDVDEPGDYRFVKARLEEQLCDDQRQ